MLSRRVIWPLAVGLLLLSGCAERATDPPGPAIDTAYQQVLMEALLDAQPGDVIDVPEGKFQIDRGLSLTVSGVMIRGAGHSRSILSFAGQKQGAEGLLVTGADDFVLENIALEDSVGDAVKITGGSNIVLRGVRVEWTNGPDTDNGAYGLYPVLCENVLIEDSIAIGASDAGIYVGQSRNIIVRRNRAEANVAGIEIENSTDADVYGNTAVNNTGGILVFNMPNLPTPGAGTRVFDNDVLDNNTDNFGHEGTPVASVPAGTGILINANDDVEIFGNRLANNKTAHVIVSSLFSAGFEGLATSEDFDPYPERIYVHDNSYEGGGDSPDGLDMKALKLVMFGLGGSFPPVVWDGYLDPAKLVNGALPASLALCVTDSPVLMLDGPNDYADPLLDEMGMACEHAPRAPVTLAL